MQIEHFETKEILDISMSDFMLTVIDFDSDLKKILSFCIIQIFLEGEKSNEIIKFDAAHGICHVHKYYQSRNSKELLFNKGISQQTVMECKKDIRENWRKYEKWFIEKWINNKEGLLT